MLRLQLMACRVLLVASTVLASLPTIFAEEITPLQSTVTVQHDGDAAGIYFDAVFDIDLTSSLEEVLHRGIPLYFKLEFELEKKRWYWTNRNIIESQQEFRLSFSPLTRQYRLSTGGITQSFDSLSRVLPLMSRVRHWRVGSARNLNSDDYEARARFSLDTSQLPKPFQVTLKRDEEWSLDSEWFPVEIRSSKE